LHIPAHDGRHLSVLFLILDRFPSGILADVRLEGPMHARIPAALYNRKRVIGSFWWRRAISILRPKSAKSFRMASIVNSTVISSTANPRI